MTTNVLPDTTRLLNVDPLLSVYESPLAGNVSVESSVTVTTDASTAHGISNEAKKLKKIEEIRFIIFIY